MKQYVDFFFSKTFCSVIMKTLLYREFNFLASVILYCLIILIVYPMWSLSNIPKERQQCLTPTTAKCWTVNGMVFKLSTTYQQILKCVTSMKLPTIVQTIKKILSHVPKTIKLLKVCIISENYLVYMSPKL